MNYAIDTTRVRRTATTTATATTTTPGSTVRYRIVGAMLTHTQKPFAGAAARRRKRSPTAADGLGCTIWIIQSICKWPDGVSERQHTASGKHRAESGRRSVSCAPSFLATNVVGWPSNARKWKASQWRAFRPFRHTIKLQWAMRCTIDFLEHYAVVEWRMCLMCSHPFP